MRAGVLVVDGFHGEAFPALRELIENGITSPRQIAEKVVEDMSPADIRLAAIAYLENLAYREISERRRTAERRAFAASRGFDNVTDMEESDAACEEERKKEQRERAYRAKKEREYRSSPQGQAERKASLERLRYSVEQIDTALRFTEKFLSLEFPLGNGRCVTWGDATPDDHRRRIHLLQKQMDGVGATKSKHEEVLALLIASGASSLRSLRGEAAAV